METLMEILTAKDTPTALTAFQQLETDCRSTPTYGEELEKFLPALAIEQPSARGRAFKFFMVNARWDSQQVIDQHLTEIFAVLDESNAPIVRQCLPYLLELAESKPQLIPAIRKKLDQLDLSRYKASMQSLLQRDRERILEQLK